MKVPVVASPLEVYAGDSWSQSFVFLEDGDPIDLSTWTGWTSKWRPSPGSDTFVSLTVNTAELATGEVTVSMSSAQTAALNFDGVVDLQATSGSDVRTFIRFRTTWVQDVTRV